jgi:hypothetical protein
LIIAVATGAIAASVLALAWFGRSNVQVVKALPPAPWPTPTLATSFDPSLPSVWSFRRAAADSEDQFNVLLDQHAGRAPMERSDNAQIRGFGGFETIRHDFQGEL